MRRWVAALGTAAAMLIGAGACGDNLQDSPTVRQSEPLQPVDVSILQSAGGLVDARVFEQPREMASERAVVALGEIAGFSDGYEVLEKGSAKEGYDVRERTVVVEIELNRLYKSTDDAGETSDSIFVRLFRGAQQEGVEEDNEGPSTITPIADFERAIPIGSIVIVMADPVTLPQGVEVIDPNRGFPTGRVLFGGSHPQTLTFETQDGGASAWREMSFAEVQQELESAFPNVTPG